MAKCRDCNGVPHPLCGGRCCLCARAFAPYEIPVPRSPRRELAPGQFVVIGQQMGRVGAVWWEPVGGWTAEVAGKTVPLN